MDVFINDYLLFTTGSDGINVSTTSGNSKTSLN